MECITRMEKVIETTKRKIKKFVKFMRFSSTILDLSYLIQREDWISRDLRGILKDREIGERILVTFQEGFQAI